MDYINYKKINKAKEKTIKKNEKIAAKEAKKAEKEARKLDKNNKDNLPSKESKGVKKFFKKLAVRLGLTGALAASVFSVGKAIEGTQNVEDNSKNIQDNADRLKDNTDERVNDFMKEIGVNPRDVAEFVEGNGKKIEVKEEKEVETETQNELKDELVNQTIVIDEKYQAPNPVVIDEENDKTAKQEVGLKEDETTPIESVISTEENNKVVFDKEEIVEEINEKETTEQKEKIEKEEETTQVTIEREDEEKPDIVVEVNDGAQVTVEDGTIKVEDASGTITIENEEETTKEPETIVFENKNPFEEDDLER